MTSNIMWHIFVWFLENRGNQRQRKMKSDIWDFPNIKTVNNLVISHIFAHLNLLFIRLSVEWSVRDDSDYDVEDDNTAKRGATALQVWPLSVTLSFRCVSPFASLSFWIFSVLHGFSHERRSAVFYHLSNAGRAHTDTRKMMKISNAVGKIEILHMINERNGKNIKNSYEINDNEMIKQILVLALAHNVDSKRITACYGEPQRNCTKYAQFHTALMKRCCLQQLLPIFFYEREKPTRQHKPHEAKRGNKKCCAFGLRLGKQNDNQIDIKSRK